MNAQYTPGPWTALERGCSDMTIRARGKKPVAAVLTFLTALDGAQSQANARLIAAAPEILSALETLYKAIDLGRLHVRRDFHLLAAHAQAQTAIRKAGGEA